MAADRESNNTLEVIRKTRSTKIYRATEKGLTVKKDLVLVRVTLLFGGSLQGSLVTKKKKPGGGEIRRCAANVGKKTYLASGGVGRRTSPGGGGGNLVGGGMGRGVYGAASG